MAKKSREDCVVHRKFRRDGDGDWEWTQTRLNQGLNVSDSLTIERTLVFTRHSGRLLNCEIWATVNTPLQYRTSPGEVGGVAIDLAGQAAQCKLTGSGTLIHLRGGGSVNYLLDGNIVTTAPWLPARPVVAQ